MMYMTSVAPPNIIECQHERKHAVRRVDGSGVLKVYEQCPDCGHSFGQRKKADYRVETLPWWDDSIIAQREKERAAYYESLNAERETRILEEREDFNRAYAAYLRTPEWARVKRRALVRDHFRCQHCFAEVNETTSQAHHILPYGYDTFRKYGYSLTFEVVTLCLRCHALAHKDKQQ